MKLALIIAGFVLCIIALVLSVIAIISTRWLLVEGDYVRNHPTYPKGIYNVWWGMFGMCARKSFLDSFHIEDCSYEVTAEIDQLIGGRIHRNIIQALAIFGAIGFAVGVIFLTMFFILRQGYENPPKKALPYAASIIIGIGAVVSLVCVLFFLATVYANFAHRVATETLPSGIQVGGGNSNVENEVVHLSWSFFVCVACVCCGVVSAILTAVGANKLTSNPVAPYPMTPALFPHSTLVPESTNAGVFYTKPVTPAPTTSGGFYNSDQSAGAVQVPPSNHRLGQATDPPHNMDYQSQPMAGPSQKY